MSGCEADGKTKDDADVAFAGSLEGIVVLRQHGSAAARNIYVLAQIEIYEIDVRIVR